MPTPALSDAASHGQSSDADDRSAAEDLPTETSTKGTMDLERSARNSCNNWPLYAC